MTENTFQTLYQQRHLLESAFRARGDKASFSEKWIISIIVPVLSLNIFIFLVQRSHELPFHTWLIAICGILGGGLFITALISAFMNKKRLSSIHALGFILTTYAINNAGFFYISAWLYLVATVLVFCACLRYAKTFELNSSEATMFIFIAAYSAIFLNWIDEVERITIGLILLYCCLSMCMIIGFRTYKTISSLLLLIIIAGILSLSSVANADEKVVIWMAPYLFYAVTALSYETFFWSKQKSSSYTISDLRIFTNQSFYFCIFVLFFLLFHFVRNGLDSPQPSEIIFPSTLLFVMMQIVFSRMGDISCGVVRVLICLSTLDLAILSALMDTEQTWFWNIVEKVPGLNNYHLAFFLIILSISHLFKWKVITLYKSRFGFSFLQFWSVIVISLCYFIFLSDATEYDLRFYLPEDLSQISSADISIIPSLIWLTFLSVFVFVASKFYHPQDLPNSPPWWLGVFNNRTAVTVIRLYRDTVKWVQKEKIVSPLLIAGQFFQSILKFLKGSKSNLSSSDMVMLLVLGFLVLMVKQHADFMALKLTLEEIKTSSNTENIAHYGNLITIITTGMIVGSVGIFSNLLLYRFISMSAFFLILYNALDASFRDSMPYEVTLYFWLGASVLGAFLGIFYWLIMSRRGVDTLP